MDDFFKSTEIGVKTLSFPNIDDQLSVSIDGCLSVQLQSKIKSDHNNFIIVYKEHEYQCDEEIVKHFVKLPLSNSNLKLNFTFNSNTNDNFENSIDTNDNNNDSSNSNIITVENNENTKADNTSTNETQVSLSERSEENSSSNAPEDVIFAQTLFTGFFNGNPIGINRENISIMEFFVKKENLNIPSFLKIRNIFNKFYEIYDKMDIIADIQYDLICISENIGIDENQFEILRSDSIESLDPDFDQNDKIQQISSFGSLRSLEFPPPIFSMDFLDKINNAIDDLVDRIANEPELTNNLTLLYNILMKAALNRPENAKFYVTIIKKLSDPEPEGKGIKIADTFRQLYLNRINKSTDLFLLHELMVGGIFTRKEILDAVKGSTSLEFKIWFAPYIEERENEEEEEENSNQQDSNNDNNNNNNNKTTIKNKYDNDVNEYSNIIQDIEDHIYSIQNPEERAFKAHFFASIRENNWSLHKVLARQGANHTPIARAIRRDDVKKLQKILAFNSKSTVDDVIKWSAFDHIPFIMNSPTLIQYAAFYGSVKCFKYLMLNEASLDKLDKKKQSLINFAVAGGNAEIVRICMQRKLPTFSIISPACTFYRFDMLDWILENVFTTIPSFIAKYKSLQYAFLSSLDSFNFISTLKLLQFMDQNALYKSAAVDNELMLDIFSLFEFKKEQKITMLIFASESYNFERFKRLFYTLNIKRKNDDPISSADDSTLEAIAYEDIDDNNDNNQDVNENNDNNHDDNNNQNLDNNNNNIQEINIDNDNEEDNSDDEDIAGAINEIMNQVRNNNYNSDDEDEDFNYYDIDTDNNNEGEYLSDSNIINLLSQAIYDDNPELLRFIDEKIIKIDLYKNLADDANCDIIELSVINGSIQCLKYFTERPDFDISMWNKDGYSILRLAILYNQSVMLKFLLSFKGLNVNNTENGGGSAFTAATWDNQIPLAKILYKYGGVDINMRGKLGETPLTGTVLQDIPKMMEFLLSLPEIDVYKANKDDQTPMMLCLEKHSIECFFTLSQCDKFDINSPKSCFDRTTAVFCLTSDIISTDMIQIVINSPEINLEEIYNGETVRKQLQKKLLNANTNNQNNQNDE
ncbi:hypothetical protein M9Y10_044788 [Tritrichomonas musculus]|uniref:DUF3447 domain-containing protein n=1 Tax=Tritrichomonas musculus TaxID=1915356 RepID=A0ABR2JU40_9EUKA